MKFHRGSGPLVSVTITTRGRSKWLCEAIDSLYSLAEDKSAIEFLLKVDDDDTETIQTVSKLSPLLPMKTIIYPRGKGYQEIHLWVQDLCSIARGDWLFLFNDDARMTTAGWDQIILYSDPQCWHGVGDICLYVAPTIDRPGHNEFVIFRKKIFDILGGIPLSPHTDNWLYSVLNILRSVYYIPIYINHLSDKAEDDTRKQSLGAYALTYSTINSIPAVKAQIEDANKLLKHIENHKT